MGKAWETTRSLSAIVVPRHDRDPQWRLRRLTVNDRSKNVCFCGSDWIPPSLILGDRLT